METEVEGVGGWVGGWGAIKREIERPNKRELKRASCVVSLWGATELHTVFTDNKCRVSIVSPRR